MLRQLVSATLLALPAGLAADPLPSWTNTPAKERIIAFVETVTTPGTDEYVIPADRVAVFDNDGTLWAEQPVYFQFIYAMDELAEMAQDDPSILTTPTLEAAAKGDAETVLKGGEDALIEVVSATHSGLSVEAFQASVAEWFQTERHPQTGLAYDQMTYQPMVELLRYLRDEGFSTYIVSGGGLHFMRVFTEDAYGIPPNQVLGTYAESTYELLDGTPTIMKAPALAFIDDKEGKPINIERSIGKRPIMAVGNSDGDFAMLEWTTAGDGPRMGVLIHHTDAEREWAYDRDSHIGRLVDGLDKGPEMGWVIVDMAKDWSRVFTGSN